MNLNNLPFKVFGIKRMPENPLWNKYISFMNHIFDQLVDIHPIFNFRSRNPILPSTK